MATILTLWGWRLFFYSNEGNEPIHVHARKGDAECKFWFHPDIFDIEEVWAYNLTPRLKREIRQIIFQHYDIIVTEWNSKFGA